MSQWINNELPPNETPVLCYLNYEEIDQDGNKTIINKIIVGIFKDNSCWIMGDNWQYYKICCTHWMPLPEPPK